MTTKARVATGDLRRTRRRRPLRVRDPHPQARWEGWNTSFETRNPDGEVVKVTYELQDVTGDVVRLTETLSGRWWDRAQIERGALRFLDPDTLAAFLHEAGFVVEEQF